MTNITSISQPAPFTRLSVVSLSVCLLLTPFHSIALDEMQDKENAISVNQVELERQRKLLIEQSKQIEALQRTVEALITKLNRDGNKHSGNKDSSGKTSSKKGEEASNNKPNNKQKSIVADNKPVGQAPPESSKPIVVDPITNDSINGVLTGKGNFVFEPAIAYSYTENNRVFLDAFSFIPALVVGLIDLREIKRHSVITSVSGRYGLTERWEFDLKVPYIGRNDTQRSRPVSVGVSEDQIFNASGQGLGDIEISTRYQLNSPSDNGPIYVANLVATIPTGTSPFEVEFLQSTPGAVFPTELPTGSGYVSVQPSLTAIYPTDPGVFFGNISYGYNMDTDEEVGNVDPGDSAGISFGLGISLNERTSISLSYSHKHVLKSKIDDIKIDGSQLDIGQFIVGYSFRYSEKTNISLSLAIGVTNDAQDTRLNFRLPITY